MRFILLAIIKFYQFAISPFIAPSCRYAPTCSCYALESIQRHGALYGSWLAVKRILRCHPWHEGGYDPVPDTRACKHQHTTSGR